MRGCQRLCRRCAKLSIPYSGERAQGGAFSSVQYCLGRVGDTSLCESDNVATGKRRCCIDGSDGGSPGSCRSRWFKSCPLSRTCSSGAGGLPSFLYVCCVGAVWMLRAGKAISSDAFSKIAANWLRLIFSRQIRLNLEIKAIPVQSSGWK